MNRFTLLQKPPISPIDMHIQPSQGWGGNRPIGMFFFKIMNRVRLLQKPPISSVDIDIQPFQGWGGNRPIGMFFLKKL
ncbi:MAG: hypothetical protein PSX81_05905 [bacterium]|nr:hypothetical protein [bacterium]